MLQTETQQDKCWPDGPRGLCADSTSTSELLFASILDQIIVQNIPYEYFYHKGKSQLFIHELAQGAFDFLSAFSSIFLGFRQKCFHSE